MKSPEHQQPATQLQSLESSEGMSTMSPPSFNLTADTVQAKAGNGIGNVAQIPSAAALAGPVQRAVDIDALCEQIHAAIDGWGTDEAAVFQALEAVQGDYDQIESLKSTYQTKYGTSLESDIRGDFSGRDLQRCLTLLGSGGADGVVDQIEGMEGDEMTWVPSSPGQVDLGGGATHQFGSNNFAQWALAATEGAAPPVAQVTTINCWEMVLLAAYNKGLLPWQRIHDTYTSYVPAATVTKLRSADPAIRAQGEAETGAFIDGLLYNLMTDGPATTFRVHDASTPMPNRGDVVFFDGAAHVALATGNGDEIYTFWPPPNTAFTAGGTVDAVKTSTITELSDWMDANFGAAPSVTFYAPSW